MFSFSACENARKWISKVTDIAVPQPHTCNTPSSLFHAVTNSCPAEAVDIVALSGTGFEIPYISLLPMLKYFSSCYRFLLGVSTSPDHYIYFFRTLPWVWKTRPFLFFPSFVQVGVRRKQRSVNANVSLKVASSPLSRHRIALGIFLTLLFQWYDFGNLKNHLVHNKSRIIFCCQST